MSSVQQSDPTKNLNQFNKFLQNNVDFLKQKYAEHFVQQFLFQQLQTKTKLQSGIKFIYDVFSFQKYENDQKMNATLKKSLRQNILSFIKNSQKLQNKKFDAQEGIKMLKFCIQNNQMFAVHYDKKQKKLQSNQKLQQTPQKQPNEDKQNQNKQQQQQPEQNVQHKQQRLKNDSHVSSKSIKNIAQEQKIENKLQRDNQFTTQNKTQDEKANNQLLKKQAKIVFEFYCKQQLNAGGPNATFDKISHEANTMTLGKFMAFANTTGILYQTKVQAYKPKDHKVLDKKTINQIFRKISKAQKQINFQQFFQLIKILNEVDNSVYEKLNMNKDQTHNKIVRKLKYLNTPFAMKGPFAKQPQVNIDQKPYVPITTGHSGKFQHSLKEDIQDRRKKLRLLPHQPYPNPNQIKIPSYLSPSANQFQKQLNQSMLNQSKVGQPQVYQSQIRVSNHFLSERKHISKTTMNQKTQVSKIRLQNSKISFDKGQKLFNNNQLGILQDLIVHDDDENDDEFLKDYKIPKLKSNLGLKRKANNISTSINNTYRNSGAQQTRESNHLFTGLKSQRKNVVDQMKLRIKQIQKTQRKQLTSLENKRKSISNYDSKKRY